MSPLKTLLYVTCVASIASSSLAMDAQDADKNTEPLKVEFSRAFGAPADGSWDGLFSGRSCRARRAQQRSSCSSVP